MNFADLKQITNTFYVEWDIIINESLVCDLFQSLIN